MPYRLATPEKRTAEGRTTDPLPFEPWEAIGAGSGNRTRVFSLEGCCFTPKLPPLFHKTMIPQLTPGPWIELSPWQAVRLTGYTVSLDPGSITIATPVCPFGRIRDPQQAATLTLIAQGGAAARCRR